MRDNTFAHRTGRTPGPQPGLFNFRREQFRASPVWRASSRAGCVSISPVNRRAMPVVFLILSIGGFVRFMPDVRLVQAIGLFASGALAGVSLARLFMQRRG